MVGERDVELIDLYRPLSGKKELFPDTVHPSAEGYRLIAEEIAGIITSPEDRD